MDQLFHRLGKPPFRLEQITPLLDEASSLSSNPEVTSAQYHDTAIETAESIEALTWLVEFGLAEVFPQFAVKSDSAEIEGLELYHGVYIPPTERDILDSIWPKVLQLKGWIFDGYQRPSPISRSALDTAQLCQYCNWPFQRLAKGPNESHIPELPVSSPRFLLAIDDWPALPVLKERSLQGCEFCLFLREHLLSLDVTPPEKSDEKPVHVWIEFCWDLSRSLDSVFVILSDSMFFRRTLRFTIDTIHDNVADDLGIFRSPATTSLGPTNLDFVKHQLASTEKSVATSSYRPKRLLDLGVDTQSEPKLINGQQVGDDFSELKYAALSYCWGSIDESKKQLKLNSETQRLFYTYIPSSLKTPVLRDAITVCQALGLRYLWIDSLCIQQDGVGRDWEEQSEEMSHIFGNSWLTICAPASNSCLDGFLDHPDRHSSHIEIEFVAKESHQTKGSFFLRLFTVNGKPSPQEDGQIVREAPLIRDLVCSRWNTRGWVFQERILSPRLLYFGARMIHFQHGGHVISEDGSSFDGDFFNPRAIGFYRHCSTNLVSQLKVIQNRGPFIMDLWYRLLTVMRPSSFTDRRDSFPATAGVARRVSEFTNHQYLAGLWEEDLCCGLLWKPRLTPRDLEPRRAPASLQQLLQTVKKSTNWIAPSWSWASRRSCIMFLITSHINTTCRIRRHLRAEFRILESHVLVNGVNPYGRIDSASISLSGSTIKMTPGSPAYMQPESYYDDHYLCEPFPDLFALVEPDWKPLPGTPGTVTGIKKQMRAHFQLLLIASCCSDCGKSSDTRPACIGPRNDRAESEAEPSHRSQDKVWSGKSRTPDETGKKYSEAMKTQYRDTFYEDGRPDFDAAVDCNLCSDHTLRRDVWGLLIYPAGPMDTYYRVGTFFSRAEHGGSAIFEGIEPRRIDLV